MPAGAIAYIRTSTSRQELSPAAQRHAIEEWAAGRGVDVLAWHQDLDSSSQATVEQRPVLAAAIYDVRKRDAEYLVAARPDRFDRRGSVSDQIRRLTAMSGGVMVTADGALGEGSRADPTTLFIHQILALVREYEVNILRARVREGLAAKARSGRRTGSVPLGWRLGKRCKCQPRCRPRELKDGGSAPCEVLVIDREERTAGQIASKLRAAGTTLRAIGGELEKRGYEPRGRSWHPQTVKTLIAAHGSGWSRE